MAYGASSVRLALQSKAGFPPRAVMIAKFAVVGFPSASWITMANPPSPPRVQHVQDFDLFARSEYHADGTITVPEGAVQRLLPTLEQVSAEELTNLCRNEDEQWLALNDNRLLAAATKRIAEIARSSHPDAYVYIHPVPVGFDAANAKSDWIKEEPEHKHELLHCFNHFLKAPGAVKRGDGSKIHTQIALFVTPTTDFIRDRDTWRSVPWHVWAAVLASNAEGYGKALLIYEPDSRRTRAECASATPRDAFWGLQGKFFNLARRQRRLDGVWMKTRGMTGRRRSRARDEAWGNGCRVAA